MEQTGVWYIDQRAEQLAFVYLSRRNDLIIQQQPSDSPVDYLVTIAENGAYTGKMFGVQVMARLSIQSERSNAMLRLDLDTPPIPADLPFPLCLFAFSMDTDAGYYRWLKAPTVDETGKATLAVNRTNLFNPLTRETFDQMINDINLWYTQQPQQAVAA